jgi:hypothetical protein
VKKDVFQHNEQNIFFEEECGRTSVSPPMRILLGGADNF